MGMTITRFEKTIIPQTLEGRSFADNYEKGLKEHGAFGSRSEDTQSIVIKAQYYFTITSEEEDGNN